MRKARFSLSVASAVLVMLVLGCGAQPAAQPNASAPAPANQVMEAPKERKVKDEIGHEITIPAEPKRIIGIYLEDELTSLGITPIRQARIGSWSGQQYLGLSVPDIDIDGSVEAFLDAGPDLILINVHNDKKYEQFSKVAPMYAFKDARADWRATIRTLGDLLNKKDKAEGVIQAYDQKAKSAAERIKQSVGEQSVAILRVHAKELRLYGGPGYAGPVVHGELGLKPHKLVQEMVLDQKLGVTKLSMEKIPELTADHIFITTDTGAEDKTKELLDNPLWKSLPAVKNGHVYEINFETWMKSGPIADSKKIDDVVKALVK
ncbi:ABC transporter substrate-binding protein [Paenibacillus filicis]|uniref:ABC transporter substrate-binding protein n=1 Tax=Paenibacillus filicis TaxID=669464 RepID=A0ABU9DEH3_9BACL